MHAQGQKGNDIKRYDLSTPRNLENFAQFFEKRQLLEKRAQEEKTKEQISAHLDNAHNLVRARMNGETKGISVEDLIAFKKIRGKSTADATKEARSLFSQIGKSGTGARMQ